MCDCVTVCVHMCVREREKDVYQIGRYKLCRRNKYNPRAQEYYWIIFKMNLFVKSSYPHSLVSLKFLLLNVEMEIFAGVLVITDFWKHWEDLMMS